MRRKAQLLHNKPRNLGVCPGLRGFFCFRPSVRELPQICNVMINKEIFDLNNALQVVVFQIIVNGEKRSDVV